jgi:transcriptional regulator with XRE-family HTH domain
MSSFSIGEYVKRLRQNKDWSQRELARRLQDYDESLSYNFVRKLEDGKTESPIFKNVIALASVFRVDIENFVLAQEGIDPDKKQPEKKEAVEESLFKAFFRGLKDVYPDPKVRSQKLREFLKD